MSRYKRNQFYENRFKVKDITEFPVEDMNELYVNENLMQRRKRLFWKTKQMIKELDYKIWMNNGQIFVRGSKENDKILIRTESDLDNL